MKGGLYKMASIIFICVIIITVYVFKSYKKIKQMCTDVALIADYTLAVNGQGIETYSPTSPLPELKNEQK